MIQSDLAALRAQFFTAFAQNDPQITWLGKAGINPNDAKPWGRLVIEPGANDVVEQGLSKGRLQLGLITFTVTIPKGVGTAVGYDMRDKFVACFRDWRSEDDAIKIKDSFDTLTEEDKSIKLRVRFRWESFRRD